MSKISDDEDNSNSADEDNSSEDDKNSSSEDDENSSSDEEDISSEDDEDIVSIDELSPEQLQNCQKQIAVKRRKKLFFITTSGYYDNIEISIFPSND